VHRVPLRVSVVLITAQIILPGTLLPGVLHRPPRHRCSRSFVRSEDLHQGTSFFRCLGLVYMGWVTYKFREIRADSLPLSRYELPLGVKNRAATNLAGGVPTAVSFLRLFRFLTDHFQVILLHPGVDDFDPMIILFVLTILLFYTTDGLRTEGQPPWFWAFGLPT
jgi:hypothetical protein